MFANWDSVKGFFPDYFLQEEDDVGVIQEDPVNQDDINIGNQVSGKFNIQTGLWDYPALSKHKPKDMMDPELVNATLQRNELISARKLNPSTGLYCSFICKPSPFNPDGTAKPCMCGNQYVEGSTAIKKGTLYTRLGPAEIQYHETVCSTGQCKLAYPQGAEEKSIFLKSTFTAAGDEIGWDFVEAVRNTRCSFTSFCNEMTRRYQTTNIMAGPFMSPNNFISWFFCWISAFQIDFRKECDPWCGSKPPILACDGTHISISIRNMKLDRPVTDPDLPDTTYKAQHKRGDRVIIQHPGARRHLNYLSKKMLKKIKDKDIIDVDLERERTQDMLQKVYSDNQFDGESNEIIPEQQELYEALLVFTGNLPMHKDVINVLARLFLMLSGDATMSSVVPFPCHGLLNLCCDDVLNNTLSDGDVHNLKQYSIELAELLVLCQKHNCAQFAVDFCRCLVRKITNVHKHKRPAPEVEVIPNTYDPSSGCTYYFTDTGEQVRKMLTYYVSGDRKAKNPNFDDMPDVDPACSKLFPKISRSEFGYLFLWFCPVHGHSYGFHLIAGGEGRKDPFASLYKYCAHMPKDIYYDFACQLSEYCLNREPELFKNT